jgi:hypothetical protein
MSVKNESLGKAARGNTEIKANSQKKIIHLAKVISVEDDADARRIKVRIPGLDNKKSDADLPYCFPFLPLHLNIMPKKDETVKVILYDSNNEDSFREYIGPLIPQMGEDLRESLHYYDSRRGREGYQLGFKKSVKKIPTAEGIYPKEDEIALMGRDNADIVFKPSEVLIRASKFLPGKPTIRNNINPAYIQIKTIDVSKFEGNEEILTTPNLIHKNSLIRSKSSKTRTDVNLFGNKIYLVGRDNNSSVVKPYLTEEEEYNIEDNLHPIVYGDILKDFIEKLFNWAKSHVHEYHTTPQLDAIPAYIELQRWMTTELPKLNSTNIFAGGDFKTLKAINNSSFTNNNLIRVNKQISRVDDSKGPMFEVYGNKVCDSNKCMVELNMLNKASGEVYKKLTGEGTNELEAYTSVIASLTQELLLTNIKLSDLKIPLLSELDNF